MRNIKAGDIVCVHWEYLRVEECLEVVHVPVAEGDSWYFERQDGTPVAVMHYSKMVVVK